MVRRLPPCQHKARFDPQTKKPYLMTDLPHPPKKEEPPLLDPTDKAQAGLSPGQERVIAHAGRVMTLRIGLSVASFCAFVILQISAVFTHALSDYTVVIMALLLIAFFLMPRQILGPKMADVLRQAPDHPWVAKAKRIQHWMVWVRVVYFGTALLLLFALPELVKQVP